MSGAFRNRLLTGYQKIPLGLHSRCTVLMMFAILFLSYITFASTFNVVALTLYISVLLLSSMVLGPIFGAIAGSLGSIIGFGWFMIMTTFPFTLILSFISPSMTCLIAGLITVLPNQPERRYEFIGVLGGSAVYAITYWTYNLEILGFIPLVYLLTGIPVVLGLGLIGGLLSIYLLTPTRNFMLRIVGVQPKIVKDVISIPRADPIEEASSDEETVRVLRGGEFVGNRLRFKTKITNDTRHVITDVSLSIITYPRESLKLDGETSKRFAKLEPKGFRSPTFEFLPTQDCVRGDIIANVTFIDHIGRAHTFTTKPYVIRAVCDLLNPESITPENFQLKLASMQSGEMIVKIKEWTPEEMFSKTRQILESSNFFNVDSKIEDGSFVQRTILGWAKGKYTGKNIGIIVRITGKSGERGATCKITMSGEDEAMLMPAIDEIKQKLSAWLCPMCAGSIPEEQVNILKKGLSIICPFCGVTIDR